MTPDPRLIRKTCEAISRVALEGGRARIALQHPETGEVRIGMIDQAGALAILGWYLDRQLIAARKVLRRPTGIRRLYPLRPEALLEHAHTRLPVGFKWWAPQNGSVTVQPLNAWERPVAESFEIGGDPMLSPEWSEVLDAAELTREPERRAGYAILKFGPSYGGRGIFETLAEFDRISTLLSAKPNVAVRGQEGERHD